MSAQIHLYKKVQIPKPVRNKKEKKFANIFPLESKEKILLEAKAEKELLKTGDDDPSKLKNIIAALKKTSKGSMKNPTFEEDPEDICIFKYIGDMSHLEISPEFSFKDPEPPKEEPPIVEEEEVEDDVEFEVPKFKTHLHDRLLRMKLEMERDLRVEKQINTARRCEDYCKKLSEIRLQASAELKIKYEEQDKVNLAQINWRQEKEKEATVMANLVEAEYGKEIDRKMEEVLQTIENVKIEEQEIVARHTAVLKPVRDAYAAITSYYESLSLHYLQRGAVIGSDIVQKHDSITISFNALVEKSEQDYVLEDDVNRVQLEISLMLSMLNEAAVNIPNPVVHPEPVTALPPVPETVSVLAPTPETVSTRSPASVTVSVLSPTPEIGSFLPAAADNASDLRLAPEAVSVLPPVPETVSILPPAPEAVSVRPPAPGTVSVLPTTPEISVLPTTPEISVLPSTRETSVLPPNTETVAALPTPDAISVLPATPETVPAFPLALKVVPVIQLAAETVTDSSPSEAVTAIHPTLDNVTSVHPVPEMGTAHQSVPETVQVVQQTAETVPAYQPIPETIPTDQTNIVSVSAIQTDPSGISIIDSASTAPTATNLLPLSPIKMETTISEGQVTNSAVIPPPNGAVHPAVPNIGALLSPTESAPPELFEAQNRYFQIKKSMDEISQIANCTKSESPVWFNLARAACIINQMKCKAHDSDNRGKLQQIHNLLAGRTCYIGDISVSTEGHPVASAYIVNQLSTNIVSLSLNLQVSCMAVYASIIIRIWMTRPDVGELIYGQLCKCCPFLVPLTIVKEGHTEDEYLRLMGFVNNGDGSTEKFDNYLHRMRAAAQLYGRIVSIEAEPHPHGISEGWKFLARVLSQPPYPSVTASILYGFLSTAGHALLRTYGKQFGKIIYFMGIFYLPKLETASVEGGLSDLDSLRKILVDYHQKQAILPPEEGYAFMV